MRGTRPLQTPLRMVAVVNGQSPVCQTQLSLLVSSDTCLVRVCQSAESHPSSAQCHSWLNSTGPSNFSISLIHPPQKFLSVRWKKKKVLAETHGEFHEDFPATLEVRMLLDRCGRRQRGFLFSVKPPLGFWALLLICLFRDRVTRVRIQYPPFPRKPMYVFGYPFELGHI